MGSCVGKRNAPATYLDPQHQQPPPLPSPPQLDKEEVEGDKMLLTEGKKLNETMAVKRTNKGQDQTDEKGKTIAVKSGESLKACEGENFGDMRVEMLLRKDRLMSAIFVRVRGRLLPPI